MGYGFGSRRTMGKAKELAINQTTQNNVVRHINFFEDEAFVRMGGELYVRDLAFYSGVNRVANAVSKCEFKTFAAGQEMKGDEWYRWNIEPNKNQSASAFVQKWITKLYEDNAALVIETQDKQLLVADSYLMTEYALYDNVFSQVQVKDFTFLRTFKASEVLYFELNSKDMRRLSNGIFELLKSMISHAKASYESAGGIKGIMAIDALASGAPDFQDNFENIVLPQFKNFAKSSNGMLPLFKGYTYDDLTGKAGNKDDYKAMIEMIDIVVNMTARALGIPPALARGDVQDTGKAVDELLTFCIDPLVVMLQEEINRKVYRKGVISGNRLEIDTKAVKHIDLLDAGGSIDKLISSGAESINDIRKLTGQPIIPEPWADQHFITKNYSTIQDILKALGGEENAENKTDVEA
ncbi:phage portal protein, HK97 family [Eubacterium maltosivorans]|uniref:phage portal protein n=1 Tax=Eubacterium maltosivorans TaxID=2041044 RepID=UPI000882BA7B|nr:phage portal protein [Eubacterium maltosivorans]WPK78895.1 hypothetical protein EUMA32_02910 [Eubacterium maltosivorans]SDP88845.1 phage portal protein, HK97 family [Eubacterium maltosivorans]